jgi:hypothetical protein
MSARQPWPYGLTNNRSISYNYFYKSVKIFILGVSRPGVRYEIKVQNRTGNVDTKIFDEFSAFLNEVNDGVSKGKHEEKPAILPTYWLQFRP